MYILRRAAATAAPVEGDLDQKQPIFQIKTILCETRQNLIKTAPSSFPYREKLHHSSLIYSAPRTGHFLSSGGVVLATAKAVLYDRKRVKKAR